MMGKHKLEECFVAYLDILGFSKEVEKAMKDEKHLRKIIDLLKINTNFTNSNGKLVSQNGFKKRKIELRSYFFSDSFVFILKKTEDVKEDLPHLFFIIRYLQDRFWKGKLCFRGGISIGKMYWSKNYRENIILGEAMLKAYKLESGIAIYPRIVVSDSLYKYIEKEEIEGYPFIENKNLKLIEGIKKDKDGAYFLDLLNKNILRPSEEEIIREGNTFSIKYRDDNDINKHNEIRDKLKYFINDQMDECKKDPKIKQKYEWLKSYLESSKGDVNG